MTKHRRIRKEREMSRLTNKHFSINPPRSIKKCRQDFYIAVEDKLRRLEDIEDKLGIDLITLSKALTNGVWVKLEYFGCKTTNIVFEKAFYFGKVIGEEKPVIRAECREYYLKDYGKTWALTKEELEKGTK